MQITEPVTMLTDYALGVANIYFAAALAQTIGSHNRVSAWLWCAAFVGAAIAALAGGTFHGFSLQLSASTFKRLWNVTVFSSGISLGLMAGGVHASYIEKEDGSLKWLISGILLTVAGLIIQSSGFRRREDFNHNDIFHVTQIGASYLLFRFACLLRDRFSLPPH